MTQDSGGYSPPTTPAYGGEPETASTAQVAREQVGEMGQSAQQAGQQVAQTAVDQVREVASEAGRQTRDLLTEARNQARDQVSSQQGRVVEGLRALGDELRQMAEKSGESGVATEVAWNASERAHGLADWIDVREAGAMVEEIRSFARRRPGMFLVGAAVAGVLAGRLTRGVVAEHGSDSSGSTASPQPALDRQQAYPLPALPQEGFAPPAPVQPDLGQRGYPQPGTGTYPTGYQPGEGHSEWAGTDRR
jgi:hypothetical protein